MPRGSYAYSPVKSMRVADLVTFINARERHRVHKETGKWGKGRYGGPDPIITEYRFCNVRRNDDRVTKWILGNIVAQLRDEEHLWFHLVIARLFNNPDTLRLFSYDQYRKWNAELWRKKLKAHREAGYRIFNAAYIVSTNGRAMDKIDYLIDCVLGPMWQQRQKISRLVNVGQLANAHVALVGQPGLGSFMAAQVLADLKYAWPERWDDFHTFAASGPGSRRGLNRVLGRGTAGNMSELEFRQTLLALRDAVNAKLNMEPLTAHDIQNCLCEFDKYERARLKEGLPKQLYKPATLPWKED